MNHVQHKQRLGHAIHELLCGVRIHLDYAPAAPLHQSLSCHHSSSVLSYVDDWLSYDGEKTGI